MPFDRKQNFLHFPFPSPWAYLASFCSYDEKTKFHRTKVGCYGNVPWRFKNRCSDRSSTAIAELSSESQDNWADRNYKKNNKIRKQNMWLTGSLLRSQTSMYNEQLWATKHEHKKLNYHQHSSFLKMARNQHPTAGSCQNRHLWFESLKNSFIFALIYIKLF